jgi:hypothetical protein
MQCGTKTRIWTERERNGSVVCNGAEMESEDLDAQLRLRLPPAGDFGFVLPGRQLVQELILKLCSGWCTRWTRSAIR